MENPLAGDLDGVLKATRGLWDDLRGQRLFITGGTGFFGCWLLESLLWANDRLGLGATAVALTRAPEVFRAKAPHLAQHPAIALHRGDVRTFDFPAGRFSHVIHAASDATVRGSHEDPMAVFDTIVDGTRRTLEFARSCGADRLLFTSSGAVYGRQPHDLLHVPEEYAGAPDPTAPAQAYGEGKRAAEMLCAISSDRTALQVTIARCFAFVGPYLPLDAHFAVGNFIRDALSGGPIRITGDGTPYRSYLYAADLAVWLWTILLRGAPLRPYNVGSAEAVTIGELAHLVARSLDPPVPVDVARRPVPGAPAERYVPSVARAATEIGLQPAVTLREALQKTVSWHARVREPLAAGRP